MINLLQLIFNHLSHLRIYRNILQYLKTQTSFIQDNLLLQLLGGKHLMFLTSLDVLGGKIPIEFTDIPQKKSPDF